MKRTYRPAGLYLDESDHFDHGAAVLLLIRNGGAVTWKDLRRVYRYDRDPRDFHSDDLELRGTIEELVDAKLLVSENNFKGPYRVTENALKIVHALGISLTRLRICRGRPASLQDRSSANRSECSKRPTYLC